MRRAMIMAAGLVLSTFAVGCAAGADLDGAAQTVVVLSPSPAATPAVEAAAARWRSATGLAIAVAPGGVTIDLLPGLPAAPGGYGVCAITDSDGNGPKAMRVDEDPPGRFCRTLEDTIAHEVGHVICRTYAPRTAEGMCHTSNDESGVMRATSRTDGNGHPAPQDGVIDATALGAICAVAPCTAFVPES
jgi:hypothetical protein